MVIRTLNKLFLKFRAQEKFQISSSFRKSSRPLINSSSSRDILSKLVSNLTSSLPLSPNFFSPAILVSYWADATYSSISFCICSISRRFLFLARAFCRFSSIFWRISGVSSGSALRSTTISYWVGSSSWNWTFLPLLLALERALGSSSIRPRLFAGFYFPPIILEPLGASG